MDMFNGDTIDTGSFGAAMRSLHYISLTPPENRAIVGTWIGFPSTWFWGFLFSEKPRCSTALKDSGTFDHIVALNCCIFLKAVTDYVCMAQRISAKLFVSCHVLKTAKNDANRRSMKTLLLA